MLRELQRKARRDTETVTEEHLEDAKTLLGLFGAPPPRRGAGLWRASLHTPRCEQASPSSSRRWRQRRSAPPSRRTASSTAWSPRLAKKQRRSRAVAENRDEVYGVAAACAANLRLSSRRAPQTGQRRLPLWRPQRVPPALRAEPQRGALHDGRHRERALSAASPVRWLSRKLLRSSGPRPLPCSLSDAG